MRKRRENVCSTNPLSRNVSSENVHANSEVDLTHQSVDIGDGTRRVTTCIQSPNSIMFNDVTTVYEALMTTKDKWSQKLCVGQRARIVQENSDSDMHLPKYGPFKWLTYSQLFERAKNCASGLRHIGMEPKDMVGIWSVNRIEWQVVSQACTIQSMVTVGIPDKSNSEDVWHILDHSEVRCLVISEKLLPKLNKLIDQCSFIKYVIVMDDVSTESKRSITRKKKDVEVYTIAEIEAMGNKERCEDEPPKPKHLFTIMYTSGSTGVPKGVMISHKNVMAFIAGISRVVPMYDTDSLLSFLPLSQVFQRCVELSIFLNGGRIGYFQGNYSKILEDIIELKPTFLVGVPHIYDKIYKSAMLMIEDSGSITKMLLKAAFSSKKEAIQEGGKTPIWDKLVFKKFREKVGGNIRHMLSASAPLKPDVHEFLRCAFGCSVSQGYGLTETTAGCTCQFMKDISTGNVGAPLPSCEVKLVDIPKFNFLTTNDPPTGEILIRGPIVSSGYFKDPGNTARCFDSEGWFHTRDVGQWNPNGTLTIIDRKSNIIKLATGDCIALGRVETILSNTLYLNQIFVYGDQTRSDLIAVGVVDPEMVLVWAADHSMMGSIRDISQNPIFNSFILSELAVVARQNGLKDCETVKAIYLETKPFSPDNNMLTCNLKVKREEMKAKYGREIAILYRQLYDQVN